MSDNRYIVTPAGMARMRARLKEIREFDRPQNVKDIEEARAHGDLSENAEYHAAKERQGFIDLEMRQCEDRLARAFVIDPSTLSGDKVVFGARVTLLNVDTDEEVIYQIVGADDGDLKAGTISYKSPLAKALLGKEIDDEVVFRAPGGERTYEVIDISFGA